MQQQWWVGCMQIRPGQWPHPTILEDPGISDSYTVKQHYRRGDYSIETPTSCYQLCWKHYHHITNNQACFCYQFMYWGRSRGQEENTLPRGQKSCEMVSRKGHWTTGAYIATPPCIGEGRLLRSSTACYTVGLP